MKDGCKDASSLPASDTVGKVVIVCLGTLCTYASELRVEYGCTYYTVYSMNFTVANIAIRACKCIDVKKTCGFAVLL